MKINGLQTSWTIKAALMLILLIVEGMPKSYAYDFSAVCETGQTLYYTITNAEYHHVELAPPCNTYPYWNGYTQPVGAIILPGYVYDADDNQYLVTSIGNSTFRDCSGLTGDLIIPNSVTSIGIGAFQGCSGLTGDLTIPNSVTSIGMYAFYNCSSFTGSLTIGNSVTFISWYAFYECSGLTGDLIIPNSVTSIGVGAFQNCSGLTGNLIIPNSVTSIGNNAFSGCNGIEHILVGPGNTIYDSRDNCNALIRTSTNELIKGCKNTIIPNSVTSIGDSAFAGCSGLTGDLIIPNSVTTIGVLAFYECSGLTGDLTIPNAVTSIGTYAFLNCSGLTGSLTIGNSVTTIGYKTFSGCSGLTGLLTIPNSLTSIDNTSFYQCNFGQIVVESGNMAYDSRDNCNAIIETNTNTLILGCKNTVIPNTVTSIGDLAFYGCRGLLTLNIPSSVSTIGSNAFLECNLDEITVDLGNQVYDSRNNCNAIIESDSNVLLFGCKNTIIPNSVTSIGARAFMGCSDLTSIIIPNSVSTIDDSAFKSTGLTSIEIPNSVTSIGAGAFDYCNNLSSAVIGNSVSSIGLYAFDETGLTSVTMLSPNPPTLFGHSPAHSTFPIRNTGLVFYVPYESVYTYKTATYWASYASYIQAWLQKNILGYNTYEGNWYFISSPILISIEPTTVENMISSSDYDLYRFNQSVELEWENYKEQGEHYHFNLENGRGYLYANAEDVNLMFKGTFNENETEEIGLVYDANADLPGWNLVGNPFPVQAYANRSYYVMNEDGTGIYPTPLSSEVAIEPCTGVMMKAEASETNPKVTFSKTAPDSQGNQGVLQIAVAQNNTRGNTVLDEAIVSFNEGDALGKFVFNEDNAKIWIPCGMEEYAIVCAEKTGEMPLNFEAKENGAYTINVNPENVEVEYLHLIDNLTGADVDLLQTPEYTFDARKSDYASRFKLVFATNEENGPLTGSGTFAFYNGNEWVISNTGETTLQIVDMMGRLMSSEPINGNATMNLNQTPGVYMLRLVSGDSVKVQKVVVR